MKNDKTVTGPPPTEHLPWSTPAVACAVTVVLGLVLAGGLIGRYTGGASTVPCYYYADAGGLAWRWVLPVTIEGACSTLAGPSALVVSLISAWLLRRSEAHGKNLLLAVAYAAAFFSVATFVPGAFWAIEAASPPSVAYSGLRDIGRHRPYAPNEWPLEVWRHAERGVRIEKETRKGDRQSSPADGE